MQILVGYAKDRTASAMSWWAHWVAIALFPSFTKALQTILRQFTRKSVTSQYILSLDLGQLRVLMNLVEMRSPMRVLAPSKNT
jgi:hypothetical protein